MTNPLAPRFQIENVGWTLEQPDYRPNCTTCPWSWRPGDDDDTLPSLRAASTFARSAHPTCSTVDPLGADLPGTDPLSANFLDADLLGADVLAPTW